MVASFKSVVDMVVERPSLLDERSVREATI
jgi:hypothetical protein